MNSNQPIFSYVLLNLEPLNILSKDIFDKTYFIDINKEFIYDRVRTRYRELKKDDSKNLYIEISNYRCIKLNTDLSKHVSIDKNLRERIILN